MRTVVFEISPEDIYAELRPLPAAASKDLEVPAPYVSPFDEPVPAPPVTQKPEPVASTYEELVALAKQPKNVELKITGAHPVALLHYKEANNPCVMCLQPLMRICHRCQSRESPYKECTILVGGCGHLIHKHCLRKFENQDLCLTCRRPWHVSREVPLA